MYLQAVPIVPQDAKQRSSHYACFRRLICSACLSSAFMFLDAFYLSMSYLCAGRSVTGENVGEEEEVPEAIREAWETACQQKSRAAKTFLFKKWLAAGGKWGKKLG